MTIALIAHDSKKELMVQFCTAYCRILSQNQLVATGTTGKLIAEATGLPVKRFLSGKQGGDQQIAARIACNEIDLLIFFRDPINAKPSEPNEMTLLRLCDVHNIPMATNIATAEVLIHGLERGDLDWRNIVNPPQVAIVGICRTDYRVRPDGKGGFDIYQAMPLALTIDHRVSDGTPAGSFMADICYHLEHFTELLA